MQPTRLLCLPNFSLFMQNDFEHYPQQQVTMNKQIKKNKINTGRWTRAEHDKFMDALEKYGRDWHKIQKKIKTRNLLQIRSHAQKVFLNMTESDIKAYIGSDQESSFNTNETFDMNSEKRNVPQKEASSITKQRKLTKNETKNEGGRQKLSEIYGNSNQELRQNTPQKSEHGSSSEVVVSHVLNPKENTSTLQQNDSTSLFIRALKDNEEYFNQGGNFINLTWNIQPFYYQAFIPVLPAMQTL